MLITLTCHAPAAAEIGYLLGKHPQSLFEREFSAGKVWVFYPELADDHLTVAILTEIDPVGLVRGPANSATLDQYVNDRPYVPSSLTSVALKAAFSTAMNAKAQTHAERYAERMRWQVTLPAVACDAGESLITRLFAPLRYTVTTTRLPLDPTFPAWGQADLYTVQLEGEQTVPDVFSHLYVLLPVLDNSKHYYVDSAETEKLLENGGAWLAGHPERDLIARRYLRYKRQLIDQALARLAESEGANPVEEEVETEETLAKKQAQAEKAPGLHEQRLSAVMAAIREAGARSLADLGCGEGKLLHLALKERSLERMLFQYPQHGSYHTEAHASSVPGESIAQVRPPMLERILGMDVSSQALVIANRRLHLDRLPPMERKRIELVHGSLLYRDRRLEGFDVAALVEVIEHLDAPRLGAMERVVFEHARPRRVIVTTPNREYNVRWEDVGERRLRHVDHRFEWSRAECQAWAERVAATFRYRFSRQELGPTDPELGAPSQLVIFDRLDATAEITPQAASGGEG